MEVRVLTDRNHEVLGAEYCSGYTDSFGKWNTGFYCPNHGNGEPVYCCGTVTYKYCCTKRDEEHRPAIDQTVLLGIVLGVLSVVVLLTLAFCFICRHCIQFRRRRPSINGGPLYRMHCSSTASGVANMYSFSGQNSSVTTPLDHNDHSLVNLENQHLSNQIPTFNTPIPDSTQHLETNSGAARHLFYRAPIPHEPPPPYQVNSPMTIGFRRQGSVNTVNLSNPSSFTQTRFPRPVMCPRSPETINTFPNSQVPMNDSNQTNSITGRNPAYWSTKF